MSGVVFSSDKNALASINRARDELRSVCPQFQDSVLPDCATHPYYRTQATCVADRHSLRTNNDLKLKSHSNISCEILGSLACAECERENMKDDPKHNKPTHRTSLPKLDSRNIGGRKRLQEMMRYGGFVPLIPSYHFMLSEDKQEYYWPCTGGRQSEQEVELPILTQLEHLHRVRCRRKPGERVNPTDNLPVVKETLRPGSNLQPPAVPANSERPTPCPPNDWSVMPPIIDTWREWHLHHTHT